MKVDYVLTGEPADWYSAVQAEESGYDGVWAPEFSHDPFPLLSIVSERTKAVQVGTSVAVALARNPMSLAISANDLQLYSRGRFQLAIGSQVESHITRRYSMPWSRPADRMREYVAAVKAIWRSWETGEELNFQGKYYTHTLMPPFFNPGPNPHGYPPIIMGGVGPRMTRVIGEVADGFVAHGFTTEKHLRSVTLPALRQGRAAAGDVVCPGFQICGFPFVVTGENEFQCKVADLAVRTQIAFYGSTPAYQPVLALHGWDDVADQLHDLSRQGDWRAMPTLITDDILHEFAIVASPDQVARRLLAKFGDIYTRVGLYAPYPMPKGFWEPIVRELQAASDRSASALVHGNGRFERAVAFVRRRRR